MSEEFIVEGTGVAESATKVVIYPYCTKKTQINYKSGQLSSRMAAR